jgi:hypothetical protein
MATTLDHRDARQQCANEIATDLLELEHHLEQSLARAANVVSMVAARRGELGLSVLHGQRLLNDTMQLAAQLTSARETAGLVHKTADATQRQVGVRVTAGNPGIKPDITEDLNPMMEETRQPAPLRRVV